MYGYIRNGKKLSTGLKNIERLHVMRDGSPLCGVLKHLLVTEHKSGIPICRSCQTHLKKEAKAERLQAAIQRSQELFL
jgi:ribosomal protein L37AE/L43A